MNVLLHICCAPCAIYPMKVLEGKNTAVMGYFYRNNIHPYTECLKREQTLKTYADRIQLRVIHQQGYDLEGFLRNVAYRESNRCSYCYHERLQSTALVAKRGKFDAFTTTLLYSKHQKHDTIASIGESVAKAVGVPFFYHDFREGWKEGIEASQKMDLYRQPYCGCIYSEKERFYRPLSEKAKI